MEHLKSKSKHRFQLYGFRKKSNIALRLQLNSDSSLTMLRTKSPFHSARLRTVPRILGKIPTVQPRKSLQLDLHDHPRLRAPKALLKSISVSVGLLYHYVTETTPALGIGRLRIYLATSISWCGAAESRQ